MPCHALRSICPGNTEDNDAKGHTVVNRIEVAAVAGAMVRGRLFVCLVLLFLCITLVFVFIIYAASLNAGTLLRRVGRFPY